MPALDNTLDLDVVCVILMVAMCATTVGLVTLCARLMPDTETR